MPYSKLRFGNIGVKKGFVTPKQIIKALTIQAKENIEMGRYRLIGEILADLGYMSAQQIHEVLGEMFERRFGDIAISKGFIDLKQLIAAMTVQVKEENENQKRRLIGEILIDKGFMNNSQVKKVLKAMKKA